MRIRELKRKKEKTQSVIDRTQIESFEIMAESKGFEPLWTYIQTVFKTAPL